MRVSDLIGCDVIDGTGRSWGTVHDVRLVQDGPVLRSNHAAFRLDGVLAGPGGLGIRLGYTRRPGSSPDDITKGPLPLKLLFRRLNRDTIFIPWPAVTGIDDHTIYIDASRKASPPGRAGRRPG